MASNPRRSINVVGVNSPVPGYQRLIIEDHPQPIDTL